MSTIHFTSAPPPSPHQGQSNQDIYQPSSDPNTSSSAVTSHLLYVTIGLLSFFVCCFGFILLYMNIRFAKPKESKLPHDDEFECASSSHTTTTLPTRHSSSRHLSNAARMAEMIEMANAKLTIPTTLPLFGGEHVSTHSSPFNSTLNSPAITSPNSQCTEAPSICDTKDAKSPPLPDTSIPLTATVRTKSSTSIHSAEPTYSAIRIVDDEESVDVPCTPNSAVSDMNGDALDKQRPHSSSSKAPSHLPPPPPVDKTKAGGNIVAPSQSAQAGNGSGNVNVTGNGAYFVFPSERTNDPPVVSPWQHHVNDKTPIRYLEASPNGNRGTLRPMMIPSESRTDSLATISVSIPTGHSSLSSTQRQLQPIMYQAPGQQHMAQMMQIMSVSQPPSLSSFLASNRSIRSGGDLPSQIAIHPNLHHHASGTLQSTNHHPVGVGVGVVSGSGQAIIPSHNAMAAPTQLSPRNNGQGQINGMGSPLSTQFDSNELKAHQHIRLPPSHSSLTTLKPPESILSGLTSITSATRSRTRKDTFDRHAGSQFTALSQSDHSDHSENSQDDDDDDDVDGAKTGKLPLVSGHTTDKKKGKRFQFGNYSVNPYGSSTAHPPQHHSSNYSNNQKMSVFNAYNKMMESPQLSAHSGPCVSPTRTNDSWTKSHFSGTKTKL